MNNKYEFFWSGPFSQWYHSEFVVNGRTFNCAEQYMMFAKALIFGDVNTAERIMSTKNPQEQKKLGRQVKDFVPHIWGNISRELVYQGNMAKFLQNCNLYDILLDTGDKILVEASPYDKIWGIGLDEEAAKITPPNEWPGTNWLGEVLTQVRTDILKTTGMDKI